MKFKFISVQHARLPFRRDECKVQVLQVQPIMSVRYKYSRGAIVSPCAESHRHLPSRGGAVSWQCLGSVLADPDVTPRTPRTLPLCRVE